MKPGVSIIVCCHNSEARLPPTLEHLLAQEGTVPWDLIVVDNNCSDGTVELVRRSWTRADVPLTVVREDTPGLTAARLAGIAASEQRYFCFIDDDNWIAPDWVRMAFATMESRPRVGATGSQNEGVYEGGKPDWIDPWLHALAIGAQLDARGKVREFLFGAGLTVRREAWDEAIARGFRFRATDRVGTSLASGGDFEMCIGITEAGWELHYEPTLRLKHYMPAWRLRWEYIRRLHRGFGASSVCLDPVNVPAIKRSTLYRLGRTIERLVRVAPRAAPAILFGRPGDAAVLALDMDVGRLKELVRTFGR